MDTSNKSFDRRTALKASSLIMMGLSFPSMIKANTTIYQGAKAGFKEGIPAHFPNIDPEIISEVVGKSHFNLERVKELVDARPELAKSVWEWRFGDFESAIGAASHVGRRDIAQYLMNMGASPTIYTYAMLGEFEIVKAIITSNPGIQKHTGAHGISLLDHAYAGERMQDTMTIDEIDQAKRTIEYLEMLGDAGSKQYLDVSEEEQKLYLGDYKYGEGEQEGFTIQLNMRKILSLGPIAGFGGAIYRLDENLFTYNGAPSVTIRFDFVENQVQSLTLSEPDLTVVAKKIS